MTTRLGVDIGGTGIKAALVDIDRGVLIGDRLHHKTPRPATPQAVASVPLVVATLGNDAVIVGAAIACEEQHG